MRPLADGVAEHELTVSDGPGADFHTSIDIGRTIDSVRLGDETWAWLDLTRDASIDIGRTVDSVRLSDETSACLDLIGHAMVLAQE